MGAFVESRGIRNVQLFRNISHVKNSNFFFEAISGNKMLLKLLYIDLTIFEEQFLVIISLAKHYTGYLEVNDPQFQFLITYAIIETEVRLWVEVIHNQFEKLHLDRIQFVGGKIYEDFYFVVI